MDSNTVLETAKSGAEATSKLSELMMRMFGGRFTRKQADADEYSDNKKLQLIRDNPDMAITYVNGLMSARPKTTEELVEAAQQRQLLTAIRQEKNIEKVIQNTYDELETETFISDGNVDMDWITRFFDIVKDVNNEELQLIWSKILAGEIKKPKSFSLRTLDIIRNLSQEDAAVFQKILPIIVCSKPTLFISSEKNIINKHDVYFSDIMHLSECGLLNSNSTVALQPEISKSKTTCLYNNKHIAIITGISDEKYRISFGMYPLTIAGCELYKILYKDPDEEILFELSEQIVKSNLRKTCIDIHRVNIITENKINHEHEVLHHYGED